MPLADPVRGTFPSLSLAGDPIEDHRQVPAVPTVLVVAGTLTTFSALREGLWW